MSSAESTLVFDLFGVIALHQDLASQHALVALLDSQEMSDTFWTAYWAERPEYDRGDVAAHEYWAEVGRRIGRVVTADLSKRLVDADVESWSRIDDTMVGLVEQLRRQGQREIALLSNAPVEIAGHIRNSQSWLTLFSATVFSCEIRAAKPEPAAFAAVETAVGRPPHRLILIDDRVENVAAARRRGWGGHHFRDRASLARILGAGL